jgi:hypothetical protein
VCRARFGRGFEPVLTAKWMNSEAIYINRVVCYRDSERLWDGWPRKLCSIAISCTNLRLAPGPNQGRIRRVPRVLSHVSNGQGVKQLFELRVEVQNPWSYTSVPQYSTSPAEGMFLIFAKYEPEPP